MNTGTPTNTARETPRGRRPFPFDDECLDDVAFALAFDARSANEDTAESELRREMPIMDATRATRRRVRRDHSSSIISSRFIREETPTPTPTRGGGRGAKRIERWMNGIFKEGPVRVDARAMVVIARDQTRGGVSSRAATHPECKYWRRLPKRSAPKTASNRYLRTKTRAGYSHVVRSKLG
jgi:hypothetical protein